MKKIFILTGEPSGDKLAAEVIKQINLKEKNIQYLSVGGENLKQLNIKSIFEFIKLIRKLLICYIYCLKKSFSFI